MREVGTKGDFMIRTLGLSAAIVFGASVMGIGVATVAHAAPYPNCTVAKQNGDCDIPSGSDKYQSKLDRDGDGLGCEC
jgi:hypothetical protein